MLTSLCRRFRGRTSLGVLLLAYLSIAVLLASPVAPYNSLSPTKTSGGLQNPRASVMPSATLENVVSNSFTQVGALTLNTGESGLASAVIDSPNGFAYFGTTTSPGLVVKVRLSDFTRAGALTLNARADDLTSAVIDSANGYVYFGTNTVASSDAVVKVRLSDFTRVGSLILNTGEISLTSAVIDPANGYAYFGTHTSPGIVVKVRLSDFTRVGALTLNTGEDDLESAVIDLANGYVYFGLSALSSSSNSVVKVSLS